MSGRGLGPFARLTVEAGPLAVFFVLNGAAGLKVATAAFMAATLASLAVAWRTERRIPVVPLIGGAFVIVFGGLTIALDDDIFIKVKPTVVNLIFAAALAGGMLAGRPLLKQVMGSLVDLDHAGWARLSWRWAGFFLFMAAANEIAWRTQTTQMWAAWKLFGAMPITLVFGAAQVPLIRRHLRTPPEEAGDPAPGEGAPGEGAPR